MHKDEILFGPFHCLVIKLCTCLGYVVLLGCDPVLLKSLNPLVSISFSHFAHPVNMLNSDVIGLPLI